MVKTNNKFGGFSQEYLDKKLKEKNEEFVKKLKALVDENDLGDVDAIIISRQAYENLIKELTSK